jgi:hypothetical protein
MSKTYLIANANTVLDALETAYGASCVMKIRSGTKPTHTADASTGTVLATIDLGADWMAAASGGSKAKSGTWQDTSADNSGTAAHYEIVASNGTTINERGDVTATGNGGDLTLDNVVIAAGQTVTISSFTWSYPV